MPSGTIHRRLTFTLQTILVLGVVAELWIGQWFAALVTTGVVLLTLLRLARARRFDVFIPVEFSLLAIVFVFASLYLGEVHDYYARYWWWDIALHTASGFLLGIVGFLLVHLLNEMAEIGLYMEPGFVAFFAFLFAVGTGAIWEIFEFGMDQLFGTNMQKAMLGPRPQESPIFPPVRYLPAPSMRPRAAARLTQIKLVRHLKPENDVKKTRPKLQVHAAVARGASG